MKLQLTDLEHLLQIEEVKVHSVDWMIYQVTVQFDGQTKLLYNGERPFRCRNLLEIRALFEFLPVERYILVRPDSAYDEMVGQPEAAFSDALEIELYWNVSNETVDKFLH